MEINLALKSSKIPYKFKSLWGRTSQKLWALLACMHVSFVSMCVYIINAKINTSNRLGKICRLGFIKFSS